MTSVNHAVRKIFPVHPLARARHKAVVHSLVHVRKVAARNRVALRVRPSAK